MLNNGHVGEIGGGTICTGVSSYGLFNYSGGTIDLISGGDFSAANATTSGIVNTGKITLISGGTFTGGRYGLNNSGADGETTMISGGVFYGKNGEAIRLVNKPVSLEPGLSASKGVCRFSGSGGTVFTDESLVVYPVGYHMSTTAEPVTGIAGAEFKYLTMPVSVTYNPNGGTGTMAPTTADAGSGIQLSANTFTRPGFTFAGWNTQANGTGTPYSEAQTITLQGHVTLYAQWAATYTVAFDSRGGSAVPSMTGIVAGSTISAPTTPTYSGYIFDGWFKESSCINVWDFGSDTVAGNTTLFAKWIPVGSKGPDDGEGPVINPIPGTPGLTLIPFLETVRTTTDGFAGTANPLSRIGSTIGDDENPFSNANSECFIHHYIILGIIITAAYTIGVLLHRRAHMRYLRDLEDGAMGGPRGPAGQQSSIPSNQGSPA